MENIVQTAIQAGGFKTLVKAVQAAGLVETLSSPGPFTLFAPTDGAFARLPAGVLEELLKPESKDKLTGILTYHVIPGKKTAAQVTALSSADTVNGKPLSFDTKEGAVLVGGARVVQADLIASNGVIHVIDSVVVPA
ncbi:MAG TPA: fasciclin domain-containing protein [Thermoanaerobaculia bacterium]|nr:fasciclin domain-containing protein [Thermoanaerobaculia bacterium]